MWLWNWIRQRLRDGWSVTFEKEFSWTGYTKPAQTSSAAEGPSILPPLKTYTRETFLEAIHSDALRIQEGYGIPWLYAASQAAHESRNGNSRLTVDANNLFGITGDSWFVQGRPVYWIETKEFSKDKVPFTIRRPFRRYDSWVESLQDWADLIKRRYPVAYQAATGNDFPKFAQGLQAGGYATDPVYADKLIGSYRGYKAVAIAMGLSTDKIA